MKDQQMATTSKTEFKDEARIGELAAKQPLSGTRVVTSINVKGFNGTTFIHADEAKKSA